MKLKGSTHVPLGEGSGKYLEMPDNIVRRENLGNLHLVYRFTVTLKITLLSKKSIVRHIRKKS